MTHEFLLIASAHFIALLSPGQDFLLLVRIALVHGFRRAFVSSAGIALANALWIAVVILVVDKIQSWEYILHVFRWFGAAVLAWMGWHFIRSGRIRNVAEATPFDARENAAQNGGQSAFWLGLLSGLGNPKNGLFYVSLFSLGVSKTTTMSWKIVYGLWMTLMVLVWDALISALIGNASVRRNFSRWQGGIEQMAGGLLILLGLMMALT